MSWRLTVHKEARSELAEAIDWYQVQDRDAGDRFLRSFLDAVNKLTENPFLFQRIDDDIRRVRLKDFPYNVLYFIQEDRVACEATARILARSFGRPMTFPDITAELKSRMPQLGGRLLANPPLAELTWFRAGGPAQVMPDDGIVMS